jgi:hypothetical protein
MTDSPDRQQSRSNRDMRPTGGHPPIPGDEYRQLRSEMMLRTGITFFATLAGIACYYGAKSIGVPQTVAAIAGLVFALLVWIAARSLTRDLRNRATRGQPDRHDR